MPSREVAKLSQAGQMRLKKAQGMSVGDIARLFGVSYHNAYNAVVYHASRNSILVVENSRTTTKANVPVRGMTASQLAELSEEELIRLFNAPAPTKLQRLDRAVATNEIDRRDEVAGTIGLDGGGLYARAYGGISPEPF